MSQVSILSQVTLEALPGHRSALFACRCFLARWSWAVRPTSLNGAALAVLIGNRVGGRVWMTGSFDGPGSCASPRRSDTARYPSLVIPCPLKRSQGTSTIQHHQWSPMTAALVAEMAAAGDAERPVMRSGRRRGWFVVTGCRNGLAMCGRGSRQWGGHRVWCMPGKPR